MNPDVGVHTYIRDHVATANATPANGFDHWEGDLEEDDNPANPMQVVELKQSKSLTAVFNPMYTLTVAREGDGGTVSPGVGPHEYRSGESASLSAFGSDEWLFTGWSGDVSGTLPLQTITMDANKSATAHFVQAIKITVNKVGQGSVSPGTGVYPKGGTRTFTATPASGWRWDHWSGVPSGQEGDPSLELPMDQSRTITAHFVERAKLTVVKELIGNLPADGGTVSPGEGEHEYDKGQVVNLSATPASGWRFKQWSGGASGTNPSTSVTMSGDKTVTATFIQRHTVTAESQFHGIITPESGTWDHGQSASFAWEKEQWLSFFQFTHWAGLPSSFSTTEWGAGTSDQETVNFTVNDSYHLIAYDESVVVLLTAEVDADGCTECAVDPAIPTAYIRDAEATVTATPDTGWVFIRWEGDVPEEKKEDNPLVITMDEDKHVTAVMKEEFELTIEKDGEGTVDPDVGTYTFIDGETATISAAAADEWVFSHWSGLSETDYPDGPAGPGTSSEMPLKLVMVRDESITANFVSGCLVMWPPGETSGSALMAVSELEPETESELVSVTFTSDLNVLHDDNGTFGNVGDLFTQPEWVWGEHSYPILCVMDSALTASVGVIISPAGIPFTLIGEGPEEWSAFEGTGVSTGELQSVTVTAQAVLPHAVAKYNPSIDWRLEFCSTPQSLDSTEHTIYSTYGHPERISPEATKTRIEFLIDGLNGIDIDEYRLVGKAVAEAIFGKWGHQLYPATGPNLWTALDNGKFECDVGRLLAVEGLSLMGIQESRLRWKCSDGCQAYPSTDIISGLVYNSDCTDIEEPQYYCASSLICGLTPLLHPEHIYFSPLPGIPHDSGACPAQNFQFVLRFGGGGPLGGPLGSTAENFFKIEELDGEWFYISVVPPNGPILGSINIGDELDKAGRYRMMKHAQGNGFGGQHWFDANFPATDLP